MTPLGWDGPGRLLSLWDLMQHVYGNVLISIATSIQFEMTTEHSDGLSGGELGKERSEELRRLANEWSAKIESVSLGATKDQIQRIKDELEAPITHVRVMTLLQDLSGRFMDDIGRCHLLYLDPHEADRYEATQAFGSKVYESFPSAIDDIEEASKCLALGRGTATVFHLMRVMESGLRAVATKLEIPYSPSWESSLRHIKIELDKDWKQQSPTWRKDKAFYSEVNSHLSAVKLAWRNPTMHIVKHYTPESAEDIFNAVKGFMKHLTTKLSEPKSRKRGGV